MELELKTKGLKENVIKDTLKSLYEEYDESKIALSLAKKKIVSYSLTNSEKDRHRMSKYLERKGFSYNIIYEVTNHLAQFISTNNLDTLSCLSDKSPEGLESSSIKIIQK